MKELETFNITKHKDTVLIRGNNFYFSYTKPDGIVKDEYKNQYRYFGGLQCDALPGSKYYTQLEDILIKIAKSILKQ